jgi:predicted metal-binding protein
MTKHTLFVCQSCSLTAKQDQPEENLDGNALLNQLLSLYEGWSRQAEIQIQPVGCLCICDRPCAVAIASLEKPTFLFVDLPLTEVAPALLQLCELYLDSEDGYVPRFKLPEILQPTRLARIPPVSQIG